MGRVFVTGDLHGVFTSIKHFCDSIDTSTDDIMILLGDSCINHYPNGDDENIKKELSRFPLTFLCLHGNNEECVWNIPAYQKVKIQNEMLNMDVWMEEKYPNILFLDDICEFQIYQKKYLCLSMTYSSDEMYRIKNNFHWLESDVDKPMLNLCTQKNKRYFDFVLSNTCPYEDMPIDKQTDTFLPSAEQGTVCNKTEKLLSEVKKHITYDKWICGHFHCEKETDDIQFMCRNIIQIQ